MIDDTPDSQRVLLSSSGALALVARPLGALAPSEVLLRMDELGLCSSDFHIWSGRKRAVPGVLGHEGAGTVLAVGAEVSAWRPGDFAIVRPLLACGRCPECAQARPHVCATRRIVGYDGHGVMGDFIRLDARALFAPPAGPRPPHGALVEPFSCVLHSQRLLGTPPERSMTIVGAGTMGAMHAALARARGVERVTLVDAAPDKLALCADRRLADEYLTVEQARAELRRHRAEVTVTASSTRAGHDLAFALTAAGGRVLAFASILDEPGPLLLAGRPVDSDDVHRREDSLAVETDHGRVTIVGAIGFNLDGFAASARMLSEVVDGARFVTAEVGLEDVPALAAGGWTSHLKILVRPHGGARGHA